MNKRKWLQIVAEFEDYQHFVIGTHSGVLALDCRTAPGTYRGVLALDYQYSPLDLQRSAGP